MKGDNMLNFNAVFDAAVRQYFKDRERYRGDPPQPSRSDSEIEGDYIILRNVNGYLTKYSIERLQRLGQLRTL
jgi:hypothetical protein